MTRTASTPAAVRARSTWTLPEPGLYRAARRDEVVGYIVEVGGGFISFDATSTPIGRFDTLGQARRSVTGGARSHPLRAAIARTGVILSALSRWADGAGSRRSLT